MNNFRLPRRTVGDLEANARTDLVESLASCRTRVNVQHILQFSDPFDAEDVAVAAYEDVRRVDLQRGCNVAVPAPRVASDVGHPDAQPFDIESLMLFGAKPDGCSINIPPNGPYGRERLELVEYGRRPDVAGMKNEVYAGKVLRQCGVKIGVCIGEDTQRHLSRRNMLLVRFIARRDSVLVSEASGARQAACGRGRRPPGPTALAGGS